MEVARHHHAMVAPSPSCRLCAILQSEFGIDLGWDFRTGCAARPRHARRAKRFELFLPVLGYLNAIDSKFCVVTPSTNFSNSTFLA